MRFELVSGVVEVSVSNASRYNQKSPKLDTYAYSVGVAFQPNMVGKEQLCGSPDDCNHPGPPGERRPRGQVTCKWFNRVINRWSEEGCELAEVTRKRATCRCTHLTEFALALTRSHGDSL